MIVRRAVAILNRWLDERGGPVSLRERVELYGRALEIARTESPR